MSTSVDIAKKDFAPPASLAGFRNKALAVGIVFAIPSIYGAYMATDQFLRGYLIGYMWCLGMALGGMALLMMGHMTGGNWWMLGRRVFEAAMRTLPFLALLFIPIVLGMTRLYSWTNPEIAAHDPTVAMKVGWLNPHGFIMRAVIYFALWMLWAWKLGSGSDKQDTDASPAIWRRLKVWSATGMLIYAFTITFASVDWVMSLDPNWYSTIYGFIFIANHLLQGFAMATIVLIMLSTVAPMNELMKPDKLHDYGKLIFALTMVWGYFSFSQWIIIWAGNLPDEITWYLARISGAWGVAAILLVGLQFVLPFVLLLSRDIKRDAKKLIPVALLVLFIRLLDNFWLIVPNPTPRQALHALHHPGGVFIPQMTIHWTYIVTPIALIGLWTAVFMWFLAKRPLLVRTEPQLARLWEAGHGH